MVEFSISNTGGTPLRMVVIAEPIYPGYTPLKEIVVRDENALPISNTTGHWVNINKTLFNRDSGLAVIIGMSPVWTHSAAMGMNAFPVEKANLMVSVMGLPQEAESVLAESPTKIWEQAVPTDPCIYRFYEIVGVYGPTLKA